MTHAKQHRKQMYKKRRFDLQRENIGFISQNCHLFDKLTVCENLDILPSYRDVPKKQRESVVCDTLDRHHIALTKDWWPAGRVRGVL